MGWSLLQKTRFSPCPAIRQGCPFRKQLAENADSHCCMNRGWNTAQVLPVRQSFGHRCSDRSRAFTFRLTQSLHASTECEDLMNRRSFLSGTLFDWRGLCLRLLHEFFTEPNERT